MNCCAGERLNQAVEAKPDERDRPGREPGRDRGRELHQMPRIPATRQHQSTTRQARAIDRIHLMPKLDRLHALSVVRRRASTVRRAQSRVLLAG
jgi:hypothetical protein